MVPGQLGRAANWCMEPLPAWPVASGYMAVAMVRLGRDALTFWLCPWARKARSSRRCSVLPFE